jgi:hypothetical protein
VAGGFEEERAVGWLGDLLYPGNPKGRKRVASLEEELTTLHEEIPTMVRIYNEQARVVDALVDRNCRLLGRHGWVTAHDRTERPVAATGFARHETPTALEVVTDLMPSIPVLIANIVDGREERSALEGHLAALEAAIGKMREARAAQEAQNVDLDDRVQGAIVDARTITRAYAAWIAEAADPDVVPAPVPDADLDAIRFRNSPTVETIVGVQDRLLASCADVALALGLLRSAPPGALAGSEEALDYLATLGPSVELLRASKALLARLDACELRLDYTLPPTSGGDLP